MLGNKSLQPANSGPHQFLMCMVFWLQTEILFLQQAFTGKCRMHDSNLKKNAKIPYAWTNYVMRIGQSWCTP